MRIAFITAGAAGMYCGSCLRDNALVTALQGLGHDAILIPTYTPIRTDDDDVSGKTVFYGGINVFLQDKAALFRHTPRFVDKLLDWRPLLRYVSRFAHRTAYSELGGLTISMLQGEHGHQKKELHRLLDWLSSDVKPDVVLLTNVLLSGMVPEMKRRLNVPVLATLQGDDIFLDGLHPGDRNSCLELIRENCGSLDGLIATSASYADHMAVYLGIDRGFIETIPPGINLKGHGGPKPPRTHDRPVIGFFARIAPEKGLHILVDAFIQLRKSTDAVLRVSGWFGPQHHAYLDEQKAKLAAAGLLGDFEHVDSPGHADKVQFLNSLDVFALPTVYHEPKGLPVLEAWANGVPVVLPNHGCFPELVDATDGGVIVQPGNTPELASAIGALLTNSERARGLGNNGQVAVHARYSADAMARNTLDHLARFVPMPVAGAA
ncbi:glycosyltransferase family 4 protein [soil metagenome]